MIALVVECAVGDNYVGLVPLRLLPLLLLRTHHYQGKLTRRLPHFVLLDYLLSIRGQVPSPLVCPGLGAFGVVDFVFGVVCAWRAVFFIPFLDDSPSGEDIETSLSFGDDFPILVLFQTHVLFFDVLLYRFGALVNRL